MHPLVNTLSFLPSAAEKSWKRPLVALMAWPIIGLGGAPVLGSQSVVGVIALTLVLLLGPITIAFGLLGLCMSMFGCGACVAKMWGRWTF